jgi:hypothetical protein
MTDMAHTLRQSGCAASSRWTTGRQQRWRRRGVRGCDSRRAPTRPRADAGRPVPTCYFARRWRELRGLYDRVELLNGRQLFSWVAEAGLAGIACGDLHRAEQLPGWTTLVPCEQDEEALTTTYARPGPCS